MRDWAISALAAFGLGLADVALGAPIWFAAAFGYLAFAMLRHDEDQGGPRSL